MLQTKDDYFNSQNLKPTSFTITDFIKKLILTIPFSPRSGMVENDQIVIYSEEEQEKAAKCHNHFKRCQFVEAMSLLKQLLEKRPHDFRIKHNLAI